MKKPLLYVLPLCAVFVLCALLFFFRVKPSVSIWKNYRVLAVPSQIDTESVLDTLGFYGITNVLSHDENELSTVNPIAPIKTIWNEYRSEKSAYFFDETGEYRLYYLETEPNLSKKIARVKKESINENSAVSAWKFETMLFAEYAAILVSLGFFATFLIKSKRKSLYTMLCAPFLYLCALMPLFSVIASCCTACVLSYIIQHFIQKPRWVRFVLTDAFTLIVAASFCFVTVLGGWYTALFIVAALTCSICLFFLWNVHEKGYGGMHVSFINTAKVSAFTLKTKFRASCALFLCVCVLKLFFVTVERNFTIGGLNGLSIPVPTEYTKEEDFSLTAYESLVTSESSKRVLPDLGTYISLCWKTDVFPYVSLYDECPKALPDSSVYMTTYESDDGKIRTAQKIMYTFNERYMQTVLQKVEHSPYASTERLLFGQNRFVTVSYKKF